MSKEALKDRFVVTFNSDGQPKVLMRAGEASRLLNETYPADKGWAMPLTILNEDLSLIPADGLGEPLPARIFRLDLIDPSGRVVRSAHKAAPLTAVNQLETIETLLLTRLASRCGFITESLDDEQVAALIKAGGSLLGEPPKDQGNQHAASTDANGSAGGNSNVVELSITPRQNGAAGQASKASAAEKEVPKTAAATTVDRPRVQKPLDGAPKAQQLNQIQGYARKLQREITPPETAEDAAALIEKLRTEWHEHARA
jgi:hypothetical protein